VDLDQLRQSDGEREQRGQATDQCSLGFSRRDSAASLVCSMLPEIQGERQFSCQFFSRESMHKLNEPKPCSSSNRAQGNWASVALPAPGAPEVPAGEVYQSRPMLAYDELAAYNRCERSYPQRALPFRRAMAIASWSSPHRRWTTDPAARGSRNGTRCRLQCLPLGMPSAQTSPGAGHGSG